MNTSEMLVITHFPYIIIAIFMLIEAILMRKHLNKIKEMLDIK